MSEDATAILNSLRGPEWRALGRAFAEIGKGVEDIKGAEWTTEFRHGDVSTDVLLFHLSGGYKIEITSKRIDGEAWAECTQRAWMDRGVASCP